MQQLAVRMPPWCWRYRSNGGLSDRLDATSTRKKDQHQKAVTSPSRSHLPRRPDGQPKHLAERRQVGISWSAVIRLPEIYARLADANHVCDFGHRQTTLDPSITQVACEIRFARQCTRPSSFGSPAEFVGD
jgi:hypothetical protein